MKQVYLLTGKPGSGKTSLIQRVISGIEGRAGGFYTEEMRSGGVRVGFKLITLDGQEAVLAHTGIKSRHRVSKYGVDTDALDRVGVAALERAAQEGGLVVIDEIGKMELCSPLFQETARRIIQSGIRVLGTIMSSPHPLADDIKRLPQVKLIALTKNNHPQVLEEISSWLKN